MQASGGGCSKDPEAVSENHHVPLIKLRFLYQAYQCYACWVRWSCKTLRVPELGASGTNAERSIKQKVFVEPQNPTMVKGDETGEQ